LTTNNRACRVNSVAGKKLPLFPGISAQNSAFGSKDTGRSRRQARFKPGSGRFRARSKTFPLSTSRARAQNRERAHGFNPDDMGSERQHSLAAAGSHSRNGSGWSSSPAMVGKMWKGSETRSGDGGLELE